LLAGSGHSFADAAFLKKIFFHATDLMVEQFPPLFKESAKTCRICFIPSISVNLTLGDGKLFS